MCQTLRDGIGVAEVFPYKLLSSRAAQTARDLANGGLDTPTKLSDPGREVRSLASARDDGKYLPPRRRFCRLRRLQPENRFAFFHQVETIARDRLQISWVRLQPANFPRCPRQQQLLLVALRLERVDLGPRRLHFLLRRNKQADDPEPDREKQKDKEYPVQSLPDGGFATSTEISIAGLIH